MQLVSAAMIIITENRLPAATSESEKVPRISGRAIPKVATIIDGIRLEQGTMQSVKRCTCRDPGIGIFDGESLFERNHDVVARLAADHPRDVAMPGGIVREHDVARPKTPNRAVAGFDLDLSGERNDILPPRRMMIVAQMSRRRATKTIPWAGWSAETSICHRS